MVKNHENMPIAKEILDMFEYRRNQKNIFSMDNHFNECHLSQQRSVPTEQQTLMMHQYLLIKNHRKASVTLWVHPLMVANRPGSGGSTNN